MCNHKQCEQSICKIKCLQVQYYPSTAYRKQLVHGTALTRGNQVQSCCSFIDGIMVIVASTWRSGPVRRLQFQCEEFGGISRY